MTEQLYVIETENGEVLQRGLTMAEAEFALCRHINLGAEDAFIWQDDQDWIYCDNRLPEIDYSQPEYSWRVKCLGTTNQGTVLEIEWTSTAYAKTEKGKAPRWEWQDRFCPFNIVAWKPMPEPAKDFNK